MKLKEIIREKARGFLGIGDAEKVTALSRSGFVPLTEDLLRAKALESLVWYSSDGNRLLNFYTEDVITCFQGNPVYYRNKENYFWGINPGEQNFERVHSGLPRAIVDVLQGIVGKPEVPSEFSQALEEADFFREFSEKACPLGLVEGWGAFAPVITPEGKAKLVWKDGLETSFVEDGFGNLRSVVFQSSAEIDKTFYSLLEIRYVNENGNGAVRYECYRSDRKSKELQSCDLSEVEEWKGLQDAEFPNIHEIPASPFRLFHDPAFPAYGRGVLDGKIDLFDNLDQSLSVRGQTSRLSTPIEYVPAELAGRDRTGHPFLPRSFNRQYVQMPSSLPDGDGKTQQARIETTQPRLDFEQYSLEQRAIVDQILTGLLSPATLGIDVSRKDNALAQREKEKITQITRNRIVDAFLPCVKGALRLLFAFEGTQTDVPVKFKDFASPSFEAMAQTLLPLWKSGAMSDEKYVSMLYGETLTEEEKAEEVKRIKENREREAMMWGNALSAEREANDGKYDPYSEGEERLEEGERLSSGELARARSKNERHA